MLPSPSMVLGPVASYTLTDATTHRLYGLVNSLVAGPLLVGAFGVLMNHVLTRPELATTPLVGHALPERDPDLVVLSSAAFGTVFYLLVVTMATGKLVVVP